MEFAFSVYSGFNFLREFAAALKVPVIDDQLQLPAGLGAGFIRSQQIEPDIMMVMHHYKLKTPLTLRRQSGDHDNSSGLISIIFKSQEIPQKPSIEREQAAAFLQAGADSIQIASSIFETEVHFEKGDDVNFIVLNITRQKLQKYLNPNPDCGPVARMIHGNQPFFFLENLIPEVQQLLQQLFELPAVFPLKDLYYRAKILELLYLLFSRLHHRDAVTHHAIKKEDIECLFKTRDTLLSDLSVPPNIGLLATAVGMSPTKLKNLFKQVWGNSIYAYFQDKRMERAAFLLRNTDNTVAEVGYELGFSNLSHFGRLFERQYGLHPKKYSNVR